MWIPPPPSAPVTEPAREPEPVRPRVARVPADGRQPHHFWYLSVGEVSERREWVRVDHATWEERYPSGAVSRFRIVGRLREEARAGVLVRRVPDGAVEVLIPDLGSGAWLSARVTADGDWHDLGPPHVIE